MPALLSICIPTYNRSAFLRVMLQALLPQVQAAGDDVEVWVLDNDSSDNTLEVVEESRVLGPFQYYRNIRKTNNIIEGPTRCSSGEFSWVLGDHNLLRPGGLNRVLSALRANPLIDVFYVNFRCATYPDHWPQSALRGFDGTFSYLGNQLIGDGLVSCWADLISDQSALCTQVYAHVVRTSVWKDYWKNQKIMAPFNTGPKIYPHTWMIASKLFQSPAVCVANPAFTIFNGAQSWGNDVAIVSATYFNGLPELLRLYGRQGLSKPKIEGGRRFGCGQVRILACKILLGPTSGGIRQLLGLLVRAGFRNVWLWPAIWSGFMESQNCVFSRTLRRSGITLDRWYRYWFHHCRPARWFRARIY